MTTDTKGVPDARTGRFSGWVAGGLGMAAVVAYGTYQGQQRMMATEQAPQETRPDAHPSAAALLSRVHRAAADLDVDALAALDRELQAAVAASPRQDELDELRVARAVALASRALEAAVRTGRTDRASPQELAEMGELAATARELTDALARDRVQPARVDVIEARLDLAQGHDITALRPAVMMAEYPDPELRLAALSRPLFAGPAPSPAELAALTHALQHAKPSTGLTRSLLALAREQASLATPPPPPALPAQAAPAQATEPLETAAPVTTKAPDSPQAARLKRGSRSGDGSPKKPDRRSKRAPKPAGRDRFDDLLASGCKQVRGGDPQQGFALLKEAHDLRPGGTKITLCMAQAQDKLGRPASALALVERVLRTAPRNKGALKLAARLESQRGNKAAAELLYRRLLAVDPSNATAKAFLD